MPSNSFTYAYSGGYTYQIIDPNVLKFTNAPAFSRPPTPPSWKPPTNDPFGEKKEEGEEEKEEEQEAGENQDLADEEGSGEGQPEDANGEDAEPADEEAPAEGDGEPIVPLLGQAYQPCQVIL